MSDNSKVERSIDWEDVENKIKIICYKFNNIDQRFKDDLAQELRIHAYYYSDDYYDLQRKAIDFWRTLSRKIFPEIPYIDLELSAGVKEMESSDIYFNEVVTLIRHELSENTFKTRGEVNIDDTALKILDVILEDIDGSTINSDTYKSESIPALKYRGGKINLTYLDFRFPDINYRMLQKALNRLREVLEAYQSMGRI